MLPTHKIFTWNLKLLWITISNHYVLQHLRCGLLVISELKRLKVCYREDGKVGHNVVHSMYLFTFFKINNLWNNMLQDAWDIYDNLGFKHWIFIKTKVCYKSTKVNVPKWLKTYYPIIYINSLGACVRACVRPSVRRDSSAF